ncbi:myotubularin-related protein 14-like isoform X2 [Limulus polyphemus]|uniref:Myotubularin-related protein 14-like isoform X2 n=1 Tax=Limulus polyphemus TaxID=6850 RepID=A0ABM1S5N2_LIMPO|nr:myotubularin-related protein 14-like isoform X2 [Limulus polyphemus]
MDAVSTDDIRSLLEQFSKTPYRVKENDSTADIIQKKCEALFGKDYKYLSISNTHGELTPTYPANIIIPEELLPDNSHSNDNVRSLSDSLCDEGKLRDMMIKARVARCRARLPLPVILLDGKYICRSATLSGGPEIYGRSGYDFLFAANSDAVPEDDDLKEIAIPQSSSEWQLFTKVRSQDIRLLKAFSVGCICDLMVEKKKVKFGMNVTSSEKVDKEKRYNEFTIFSLPYPGCEFFREYKDNGYSAEGLVFDWTQPFVDAHLGVPFDSISSQLDIDWIHYKSWDLVKLTQNYLKLLLKYIIEGTSGMLIHCISGWDRTPLFISLLRLSLWADGKVHPTLTPAEITYLTIAYDWYFFGHNLADRISKGEEILFFCFNFLKHIQSEAFSAHSIKNHRVTRNFSDCQLDGVLLEDHLRIGGRGSNTSLSSSCSSISSRTHDSNPPTYFTTLSQEPTEDSNIQPNVPERTMPLYEHLLAYKTIVLQYKRNKRNIPYNPQLTWPFPGHSYKMEELPEVINGTPPTLTNSRDGSYPINGNSPHSNHMLGPLSPVFSSTSPVAVPNNKRERSESTSSAGCGSWQIISGTGSIRGSESTRGSVSSPTWELNRNSSSSKGSSCQELHENPDKSPCSTWSKSQLLKKRRENLNDVRSIFCRTYANGIGFNCRNGTEASGLSNLLDQLVGKVGIRSGKTYSV